MLEACLRDDFCFNNTELMRWRKSVCVTWQTGGTAGDPSCENRPAVFFLFFFCAVGRESRVSRYLGLMPGVDVRRQDKNQRKFTGERLRLASWIWTNSQEENQRFTRTERTVRLQIGSSLSLYAPLEFSFFIIILNSSQKQIIFSFTVKFVSLMDVLLSDYRKQD